MSEFFIFALQIIFSWNCNTNIFKNSTTELGEKVTYYLEFKVSKLYNLYTEEYGLVNVFLIYPEKFQI